MSTATAAKLNKKDFGDIYYIGYSRSFAASSYGLTTSARWVGGLLGSFSGFQRTYKDITEVLNIPKATTGRSLKQLKEMCGLTKTAPSTYEFEENEQSVKGKWYCPLDIITNKFNIYDDEKNVVETRKLTYATQDVYAYFYTKLSREYNNDGYLEFTNKEIASELGYDEETVSKAVDILKHAKLIYYPKAYKGGNRHKKSVVSLVKKWSWFKKENKYRARTGKQNPAIKTKATTRDEYYGKLQAAAQKKAERALRRAERNKEYKSLTEEITSVRALFLKSLSGSDNARKYADEIERLNIKRGKFLESIGLSEEQLSVKYYVKCKRCNDTGYRIEDGERCDCFEFGARGSPPGEREGRQAN